MKTRVGMLKDVSTGSNLRFYKHTLSKTYNSVGPEAHHSSFDDD